MRSMSASSRQRTLHTLSEFRPTFRVRAFLNSQLAVLVLIRPRARVGHRLGLDGPRPRLHRRGVRTPPPRLRPRLLLDGHPELLVAPHGRNLQGQQGVCGARCVSSALGCLFATHALTSRTPYGIHSRRPDRAPPGRQARHLRAHGRGERRQLLGEVWQRASSSPSLPHVARVS